MTTSRLLTCLAGIALIFGPVIVVLYLVGGWSMVGWWTLGAALICCVLGGIALLLDDA